MNTATLTFTRFIAAICVIIFHYGRDVYPFTITGLNNFFGNSDLFVSYFFFLSGFVMVVAYHKKLKENRLSLKEFWLNRFLRIYPMYIFALVTLIAVFLKFSTSKVIWSKVLMSVLLLQAWGDQSLALSLNYPGWSLSVEVVFYLIFPLIIKPLFALPPKKLILLYLVIWIASQLLFILNRGLIFLPILHLSTFLGGTTLALLLKMEKLDTSVLVRYSGFILIVSFLLLVIVLSVPNPIVEYSSNGLLSPIFAGLITGLVYGKSKLVAFFTSPVMIKAGDISYSMYILQYPCVFINRYLNDKLSGSLFSGANSEFYTYLLLLLLFSLVTFHLIEIPVKQYFRRFQTSPTAK